MGGGGNERGGWSYRGTRSRIAREGGCAGGVGLGCGVRGGRRCVCVCVGVKAGWPVDLLIFIESGN